MVLAYYDIRDQEIFFHFDVLFSQVLQGTISEREQQLTDQATVIEKLTGKVEASEEKISLLAEKLEQKERQLKTELETSEQKDVELLSLKDMIRTMGMEPSQNQVQNINFLSPPVHTA